jgi:hypothetical protein
MGLLTEAIASNQMKVEPSHINLSPLRASASHLTVKVTKGAWTQSETIELGDPTLATVVKYLPLGLRVRSGFQVSAGCWILAPSEVVHLEATDEKDYENDVDDAAGRVSISVLRTSGHVDPVIVADIDPNHITLSPALRKASTFARVAPL